MYFTVKYIDLETFEKTKEGDASNRDLTEDARHASNKELLVNPDCFIAIIMDYIFDEVGIPEDNRVDFDMMTEQGKLLNVHNYAPDYSGLQIFEDRGQYFVAYRNKGEPKPLLNRKSPELTDILETRKRKLSHKKSRSSYARAMKADSTMFLKRNTLKSSSRVKSAD